MRKYEYIVVYPSNGVIVGSILSKRELKMYLEGSVVIEDRRIEEDELAYALRNAISVRLVKAKQPHSNLLIIKYTPPM